MGNNFIRFDKYIENVDAFRLYDFKAKTSNVVNHIRYMLNRTRSMFKWSGLPDSIPERFLELYLQVNGNACFYRHNGTLYIFTGGMGGDPDVYYFPTIYTIANPALNLSVNARIGVDCVVMPNDTMYAGLIPLFNRHATAMCETELSLDIASVNSRIIALIDATTDTTEKSARQYLDDIRAGKPGVISSNEFLQGIRTQPYASTGNRTITDLIELEQYHKASWYNDIGLNANYNMKRESINSGESQLNNDALYPLIDDMLQCRQTYSDRVNDMFGTNISVTLNSSWRDNVEETRSEIEQIQTDPETEIKGGDDNADPGQTE